jgi:predicted RND superfamily exporter protein/7-keto-8-aminopelargonate synthetase-like enzyme
MNLFASEKRHGTSASFAYRYCQFIHRNRWPVILLSILMVAVLGMGAAGLKTTNDNRVFFGPENPELQALERFEATYTESNDVLVAIAPKSGNVFTAEALDAIRQLTAELWRAPFATRVDSLTNFQHSYANGDDLIIHDLVPQDLALTPEDVAVIRGRALSEPMLVNFLTSPEGHVAGIRVNFSLPSDEPDNIRAIAKHMHALQAEAMLAHPDLDLYLTGNVMLMEAFGEAQNNDVSILVPIMLLVIGGTLFFLTRSWIAMLLALGLSILSTAAAMGFAGWIGIVMNAGSGPAPLIVMTMALAYSVHLLTKFIDDCRGGASKQVAIINTVDSNLVPIFLTSLTTAIGFLSMNASDAPPFHDLGNIVAMGVSMAFVLSFTLVPALLDVLPLSFEKKETGSVWNFKRLSHLVTAYPGMVAILTLGTVVVLASGTARIELNENWVAYFDERFEFREDTDFVIENLTGFDILEFSVPSGGENGVYDPAYLTRLDEFTHWLRAQPEVINVTSMSDVIKRLNKNLHADDESYYRIPETREAAAQYFLLFEMSLPYGLDLNDRMSISRSETRVTVVARQNGQNLPSKDLLPLADRIETWLAEVDDGAMAAKSTGLSMMFAHLSSRNIETMLFGTAVAVVLVSIVLVVALGSVKLGLVCLLANFVPALMGFGLWGYLVSEINVAISVVAAMTFGIVVDDSIHFLTKYVKGRRTFGKTPDQSIEYAFTSVGKALVFTTLILSLGFLVLATSGFNVNSSLGLLTAITLVWALVADFLLLPPVLLMCDRDAKLMRWQTAAFKTLWGEFAGITRRVEAYFERIKGGHFVVGRIPDRDAVELWSNDYLSIGNHPKIVEAQVNALRSGDDDLYMSAVYLNDGSWQHRLEHQMAEFIGAESTVLCQSGWSANVGLIQALADASTPVYLDFYAHASFWEGARAADAPIHAFRHNRLDSLERLIGQHGPGLVLVDAIYSSIGTVCPLTEMADLAERTGCIIVVDESHSMGVYGPHGEGLVALLDLTEKVHYRTFSLSKAFVTRAGMVAGPERVMSMFPYESRPAIFSSAVLPHEVAALSATLQVIQDEGWRRQQLWHNAHYLRQGLSQLGFAVESSTSHVISLHSGTEPQTVVLRDALEGLGIFGAVFCAPATPRNHALVRLSVNAALTKADLDRVIDVCRDIRDQKRVTPWPRALLKPAWNRRMAAMDTPDGDGHAVDDGLTPEPHPL